MKVALALLTVMIASGCGEEAAPPPTEVSCSAAELGRLLDQSRAGEELVLEPCRYRGAFRVKDGVHLRGRPESELIAMGGPALTLEGTARVSGLRVVGENEPVVIRVAMAASATLAEVEVVAVTADTTAVHVAAGGSLTLTDADLRGEATLGEPAEARAAGIIANCGATLTLTTVTISGFGLAGIQAEGTNVVAKATVISGVGSTGIALDGGSLEVEDLRVEDVDAGALAPSIGVFARNGAALRGSGLSIADVATYGLWLQGGDVELTDFVTRDNGRGGAVLIDPRNVAIRGSGTLVSGNAGLGVAIVRASAAVTIEGGRVESTAFAILALVPSVVEVGDGLAIHGAPRALVLRDLVFERNARVGVLIDLGGAAPEEVTVAGVRVDGSDRQLGFIVQNGTLPDGTDAGVDRRGSTGALDAELREPLPLAPLSPVSDPAGNCVGAGENTG